MSRYDIANYVVSHMQDPLSRIDGVGNFNVFGTQYAMRIWLDPDKLNSFALTPIDVTTAIQNQNVQVAGGQLGGTPAPATQQLTATITEATLLHTPEEFGNILLKVEPRRLAGAPARRRARRARRRDATSSTRATTASRPRASASSWRRARTRWPRPRRCARASTSCEPYFPHGLQVVYPYDTTPFVKISITEVVKTLFEGIVLVFLVMYLFLQNLRATLIPTIAVPVVLLGTFGVMSALRLHDQHADDVRPGAGDRPAGRRRDRRGRERRARDGGGRLVAARGDAQGDGADHRRAGRRRAWCSPRCSCRWRSRAARSARSTASSRSRSSRRCCCRCSSRCRSRRRCARRC